MLILVYLFVRASKDECYNKAVSPVFVLMQRRAPAIRI
jgi:hypothetical protein